MVRRRGRWCVGPKGAIIQLAGPMVARGRLTSLAMGLFEPHKNLTPLPSGENSSAGLRHHFGPPEVISRRRR